MIRGIAQGKKESLEYDLRGRALHAGDDLGAPGRGLLDGVEKAGTKGR